MKTIKSLFTLISVAVLTNASLALASPKAAVAPSGKPLVGKVIEVKNVPSYTYLRIQNAAGETWAAVPTSNVKVGTEVTVMNPQLMRDFQSKALNKKFETIVFGTMGGDKAEEGASNTPAAAHGTGNATPPIDLKTIKVDKASGPNAFTVAELYAKKTELKGKDVAVRGKVIKFLPGIMKKNWIHVSDGTGSQDAKNFDLTVTTDAQTKVGEVILVSGKLEADKNVGAGYFFPIMIDKAKLTK